MRLVPPRRRLLLAVMRKTERDDAACHPGLTRLMTNAFDTLQEEEAGRLIGCLLLARFLRPVIWNESLK